MDASINGGIHLKLDDNIIIINELIKSGVEVYLMHLDDELKIREMIKNTNTHICDG